MKKRLFIVSLVIFLFCGCGDVLKAVESEMTINVTGTPGLRVRGHYAFMSTDGVSEPQKVEGEIPIAYKGTGLTAVCVFRKTSADGCLKVEIIKNSKVIASSETQAPMGFVSLTTPPPEAESLIGQLLNRVLGS